MSFAVSFSGLSLAVALTVAFSAAPASDVTVVMLAESGPEGSFSWRDRKS